MSFTQSLSMTVPSTLSDDANRLMRALSRDTAPDPGRTFSVKLSPNGNANDAASDFGAHSYDDELLVLLDGSTIPDGIDWQEFGLTQGKAQAAFSAISFRGVANHNSVFNFEVEIQSNGLKRIPEEPLT